jgi:hypothetical protein
MNNGYGQIFLLLAAIGLILLGASGKAKQLWDVIKGTTPTSGSTPSTPNGGANSSSTNGSQPQYTVPNLTTPGNSADKAGSGMGGTGLA